MNTDQIYRLFCKFPIAVTDSRQVMKDSIFFALKGKNFNGNRFAAEALQKGAVYSVIDERDYMIPGKTILVDDVLKTLQGIAHLHRRRLGIPILAITGSNGKTTTKELVAAVLSKKIKVSFTNENLNNHIGMPLTLLGMTKNTEMGIVEMGANHPGEIDTLCSIADPDYGIITNIGRAHLEGFGSFEAIKKTKAELFDYLHKKKGTIFFNRDNPVLKELTGNFPHKISYGRKKADYTGELIYSPPFINLKVNLPEGELHLNTKLTGSYNFENVMASVCIGHFFGIEPSLIKDAIQNFSPQNYRSQLIEKNGLKIVMDAYNANPTSMQAAIESFVSGFYIPKCLILGDMFELGKCSAKEHIAILEQIKKYTFEKVFLIGQVFSEAAKNYPYKTFPNTEIFCRYITHDPLRKCAVLIKGSRAIQLEKVLRFI